VLEAHSTVLFQHGFCRIVAPQRVKGAWYNYRLVLPVELGVGLAHVRSDLIDGGHGKE